MGRPSCRASLLGHPSARFLAPTAKTSYFLLFLPSGAACSGPQRSRARSFLVRRRERTLDGEDRCETIAAGGKQSLSHQEQP
jgi:hypothetical protein